MGSGDGGSDRDVPLSPLCLSFYNYVVWTSSGGCFYHITNSQQDHTVQYGDKPDLGSLTSNPLISLISENFLCHWSKYHGANQRETVLCYQKEPVDFIPVHVCVTSWPRKYLFCQLHPFAGHFFSPFLFPPSFLLNIKRSIYLFITFILFQSRPGARIQPLSPVYPESHLIYHVGGGGDRGRSLCGSQ